MIHQHPKINGPNELGDPDPGGNEPNFKFLEGINIDTMSLIDDAVRILKREYCTMDRGQIVSVVRHILLSYGLECKEREVSPASSLSTAPKAPSRESTPNPKEYL